MDTHTILIFPDNDYIKQLYLNYNEEKLGQCHLLTPEPINFSKFETKTINFKIKCKMFSPSNMPCNFLVVPLPNIANTPLHFTSSIIVYNSINEPIISIPVKNLSSNPFILEPNNTIFQILAPNFSPIDIVVTEYPSKTKNKNDKLFDN
jgi:hypothetical protein